jgi:hypothetical protein
VALCAPFWRIDLLSHTPAADSTISLIKNDKNKNPHTNKCMGVLKSGVDLLSHPPAADSTISLIKNDKNKNPHTNECMGVLKSGVDLLSHPQKGSTISAISLNFSVRNGKRWTLMP